MYDLYIANKNYSSWSLRPWVLMQALDIAFTEHLSPFEGMDNHQRFSAFSPNGKVPCLHDGDHRIWESLAIVEYLAERHDGVWPSNASARAWARSASAEMHAGFGALRGQCPMTCGQRIRLYVMSPELSDDIRRIDDLWSDGLTRFGGPFLAGDRFTGVDAMFAPVAFRIQSYGTSTGFSLSRKAADYADFILSLPSMRRWYDAALAEQWRDDAHEYDVTRVGTVVEDVRAPA